MWLLASRLEDAGFHVERVGYKSLKQTPEEILDDVSEQITGCCLKQERPVHFVGHSLGGLLIRAYLQDNDVDQLGRVVLIGTPNQGNELVDRFGTDWWMKLLGPTAATLGTDDEAFPSLLARPHYEVGVIAGVSKSLSINRHLSGEHDGLVTVEATKLTGMRDFVVVETSHSAMRYNEEVANQTVSFLRTGEFLNTTNQLIEASDTEESPEPEDQQLTEDTEFDPNR